MKPKLTIILTTLITVCGISSPQLSAADELTLYHWWTLTPDSDRDHPTAKALALVAQQPMTLVTCEFYYGRSRDRIVTSVGEHVEVAQPKGGTLKVSFEVLTKSGTVQLDQRTKKVKNASLGWVDPSGREDSDSTYDESGAFPLKLRSGEAVLFSVQFKGMPRVLGVKRAAGEIQMDTITLWGLCSTCGSKDFPCPIYW